MVVNGSKSTFLKQLASLSSLNRGVTVCFQILAGNETRIDRNQGTSLLATLLIDGQASTH